ncbi:MAG: hypothetical protein DWQ06_00855 [Calditrichaeota bacterium]|nr:MAG: hypothetical protein DWQ06_00855 [Calditrichota bacterium]
MKAVFTTTVTEKIKDYLLENVNPKVEFIFPENIEEENLISLSKDAEIIVAPRFLETILRSSPKVKLVQIPWIGVQNVTEIVKKYPNVLLANNHGNAKSAAQYSVAMLLCLTNNLIQAHQMINEGKWENRLDLHFTNNFEDKIIGVIGTGAIGNFVAEMLKPFVKAVYGLKRTKPQIKLSNFDKIYTIKNKSDFFKEVDSVIVTLPLTEKTKDFISEKELRLLGRKGFIVNVGRGEVINEKALFTALKEKLICGAGIDVWYKYRVEKNTEGKSYPFNLPFQELENILMSPHRAGPTRDKPHYWKDVVENFNRLAKGRTDLLNLVDLEEGY